ncbi:hypothetical protein CCMSSC00406_0006907 [Pleurotus cornucopiae]|uniref:Uncharacterized protein n=1 Tax=Pleurotus cornucopiae TaxID=5321 RepID=A0ACB7IQF2_PLECO|nr:hypothetical protein CCMSSC00406_0006907 [Pleurotus cornucopiae]
MISNRAFVYERIREQPIPVPTVPEHDVMIWFGLNSLTPGTSNPLTTPTARRPQSLTPTQPTPSSPAGLLNTGVSVAGKDGRDPQCIALHMHCSQRLWQSCL